MLPSAAYWRTGKVRGCDYFANTRTRIALANSSHAINWMHSYVVHHWRWWCVGRWISLLDGRGWNEEKYVKQLHKVFHNMISILVIMPILLSLGTWLTLPMLRQRSTKTRIFFWKPVNPCHVGIHWKDLAEYSQMSTYLPGFQSFNRFLHHFVLVKLANSSIRACMSCYGCIGVSLKHVFHPHVAFM